MSTGTPWAKPIIVSDGMTTKIKTTLPTSILILDVIPNISQKEEITNQS